MVVGRWIVLTLILFSLITFIYPVNIVHAAETTILSTGFEKGAGGWTSSTKILGNKNNVYRLSATVTSEDGNPKPSFKFNTELSWYGTAVAGWIKNTLLFPNLGGKIPIYMDLDVKAVGWRIGGTGYGYYRLWVYVTVSSHGQSNSEFLMDKIVTSKNDFKLFMNWTKFTVDLRSVIGLKKIDIAGSNATVSIGFKVEEQGVDCRVQVYVDNIRIYVPLAKELIDDSITPVLSTSFRPALNISGYYVYTNQSYIRILWNASDNIGVWRVYITHNDYIIDATNMSSYSIKLPKLGNYEYKICAEDAAGNVNEKSFYIVRVPSVIHPPPPIYIPGSQGGVEIPYYAYNASVIKSYGGNVEVIYRLDPYYYLLRDRTGMYIIGSFFGIMILILAIQLAYVKRSLGKVSGGEIARLSSRVDEVDSKMRMMEEAVRRGGGYLVGLKVWDLALNSPVNKAKVFVDGKNIGETGGDGVLTAYLFEGSHMVEVRRSGYKNEVEKIEVPRDKEAIVYMFRDLGTLYNVSREMKEVAGVLIDAWRKFSSEDYALAVEWADDVVERILQMLKAKYLKDKLHLKMERDKLIQRLIEANVVIPLINDLKDLRLIRNRVRYQLYKPKKDEAYGMLVLATVFLKFWVSNKVYSEILDTVSSEVNIDRESIDKEKFRFYG